MNDGMTPLAMSLYTSFQAARADLKMLVRIAWSADLWGVRDLGMFRLCLTLPLAL